MSTAPVKHDSVQDLAPSLSSMSTDRIETHRSLGTHFDGGTTSSTQSILTGSQQPRPLDEATPIRFAHNSTTGRHYNTAESQSAPEAHGSAAQNAESTTPTASKPPDRPGLIKKIASKYGSISLENKGSVARDHLALERTFLAWLRTSLAFASIGIGITQLFRLNTSLAHHSNVGRSLITPDGADVPFSPFIGHSISAEMIPYLQSSVESQERPAGKQVLGPTLLDQLLRLAPDGGWVQPTGPATGLGELQAAASADRLRHLGKPLGATFIGISIVILFVGFHRYFESQFWIIRGKFPASRGSIGLVAFTAAALIMACLIVIVVVEPNQFET